MDRVLLENARVQRVVKYLNLFDDQAGVLDKIRVDQDSTSNSFDVFSNLFSAYIITESGGSYFSTFKDKPLEIFNFVKENVTNSDGGVHTIYYKGFTDNIVSLRNTV